MVADVNYVHMNRCCHGCIASHRIASTFAACADSIFILRPKFHLPPFSRLHLKIWFNLMIPLRYRTMYTTLSLCYTWKHGKTGCSNSWMCENVWTSARSLLRFIHSHVNVLEKFSEMVFINNKPTSNAIMPFNVKMSFRLIFAYSLILINWIP